MEQMHHRSPNLLGASLIRDDVYAELIADGIHVSLPAIKILLKCKPKDKLLLVSDAIRGNDYHAIEPQIFSIMLRRLSR